MFLLVIFICFIDSDCSVSRESEREELLSDEIESISEPLTDSSVKDATEVASSKRRCFIFLCFAINYLF